MLIFEISFIIIIIEFLNYDSNYQSLSLFFIKIEISHWTGMKFSLNK